MPSVFVLGATGYIGNSIAHAFRRAGWLVKGLTRSADKVAELAKQEIVAHVGDALNADQPWVAEAAASDVVVTTTADYSDPQGPGSQFSKAVDVLLAIKARNSAVRVVFTSGSWLYATPEPKERALTESDALPPPHPFLAWRDAQDQRLLAAGGIVVRPVDVYGGSFAASASVAPWGRKAIAGEEPFVWHGKPGVWKSFIHVDDVGTAYFVAATKGTPGQVYIAAGENSKIEDVIAALYTGAGHSKTPAISYAAAASPSFDELIGWDTRVDASKLRALGWEPVRTSIASHAAAVVAALRAAPAPKW